MRHTQCCIETSTILRASRFVPFHISSCTTSVFPLNAASCNGVFPFWIMKCVNIFESVKTIFIYIIMSNQVNNTSFNRKFSVKATTGTIVRREL